MSGSLDDHVERQCRRRLALGPLEVDVVRAPERGGFIFRHRLDGRRRDRRIEFDVDVDGQRTERGHHGACRSHDSPRVPSIS